MQAEQHITPREVADQIIAAMPELERLAVAYELVMATRDHELFLAVQMLAEDASDHAVSLVAALPLTEPHLPLSHPAGDLGLQLSPDFAAPEDQIPEPGALMAPGSTNATAPSQRRVGCEPDGWSGKAFYVDPNLPECLVINGDGHVLGVRDLVSGHVVLVPDPTNTAPVTTQMVHGHRVIALAGSRLVPVPGLTITLMERTVYTAARTDRWSSPFIRSVSGNASFSIGGYSWLRIGEMRGKTSPESDRYRGLNLQASGGPNSQGYNIFAAHMAQPDYQWSWLRSELPQTGATGYAQNDNQTSHLSDFDIESIGTANGSSITLYIGLMFSEAGDATVLGTLDASLAMVRERARALEGL